MMVGNVEILPDQRRVLVASKPFNLGSRAYDMLELLASARGELVSKEEIMRRVWPNTVVVENNLHVHISAIRKMLGSRADLLIAVPGRGYRLALDIPRPHERAVPPEQSGAETKRSNLPSITSPLYGREAALEQVIGACEAGSLVSLVGTGGIGKTRLAVEVGRRFVDAFADGVWLVELARLTAPPFVAGAVAAVLDPCAVHGASPLQGLPAMLAERQMLVILDNCEHVIGAAADVAEAIVKFAPSCRIIATSREPLKVDGEVVYRVPALDVPRPDDSHGEAGQTSAVQLFLDRARAIDSHFAPDAAAVSMAGLICRRLDGLPLAIELAASRAATLGITELAVNLDDRFTILTGGYRTALPQHQTLRATFDWSYGLLPKKQQAVLRRLGVFPGSFGLEAATAIATDERLHVADVVEAVCALSEKSLLDAQAQSGPGQYRLLETSRAYASQKLAENGEDDTIRQRFLLFVCARLQRTLTAACADTDQAVFEDFRLQLDDVRAALHSTFSADGDKASGIELITMAAPMFFRLGLCAEMRQHARAALGAWSDRGSSSHPAPDAAMGFLHVMAGSREWASGASSRTREMSFEGAIVGRRRAARNDAPAAELARDARGATSEAAVAPAFSAGSF